MPAVTSADGTAIAYERTGSGPALVLVDGATTEYTERLNELLGAGRNGDAVALFMTCVGMPAEAIAGMRAQPGWATLEAIAPTLAYDDEVLGCATRR